MNIETTKCRVAGRVLLLILSVTLLAAANVFAEDQLLRRSYDSESTGGERQYFVYLPSAYEANADKRWPVILFLHGNGQRGDTPDDLDFVLRHGPLAEAWLHRRELPFVMISPQMPVWGQQEALEDRAKHPRPVRLESGTPERNYGYPSDWPIQRTSREKARKSAFSWEDYRSDEFPPGWSRIDAEVIQVLDDVLREFNTDPDRVYLTGISMGGFGTFQIASAHPERFAAIAPIVGAGTETEARAIAEAKLPTWLFGGAKDQVVDPYWLYRTARFMEVAGHPNLRFTMHEDMDHDAWKRVYEGRDVFDWFLRFRSDERPGPEKVNIDPCGRTGCPE
ncbi:alpha/beta hydrolase-fold protein [Elongatibacter sediminis]|uniref:Alpha/beta hydrolase-fold protein n=1 Tax=Elongatibacter sediminis TaxID=3119006 RepID=A0AAW9R994_9GAMM